MVKLAPKIDQRTAKDIADQVLYGQNSCKVVIFAFSLLIQSRLYRLALLLQEFRKHTDTGETKPLQELITHYTGKTQPVQGRSAAIVNIFARFAEIIIERLNQVPDKNFLAFLDLLGASRLPPQPARVPLTFSLAAGTIVDAVVPKGTQVAAPPAEGEQDPVIFETERELVVTAAKLDSVFVRDPEQDLYSNHSSIITTPASPGVDIFRGNQEIEHSLYIGHSKLLGFAEIDTFKVTINLSKALGEGGKIKWQIWQETEDGANWQDITPSNDETQGLRSRGDRDIQFSNITALPLTTVNSVTSRWLRCRLVTPITLAEESLTGMVSANELPEIDEIKIEATISSSNLLIETGFTNQSPLDLTKDFFPFGENPKFGTTLYLANSQAFSQDKAEVTLNIRFTSPASGIPPTLTDGDPKLKWEFWNGKKWMAIGTSTLERGLPANSNQTFEDTTKAFTITRYFDQVLLLSEEQYIDLTEEARSSDGTGFELNKNTGDILYLGSTGHFKYIHFHLATKGQGYTLKFEYFNGTQWTQLTEEEHNLEDNTSKWTADGCVEFTTPTDWQQTNINDANLYWIRITTTTEPETIAQAFSFQLDCYVRFTFPEPPVPTMVNGVEDFWIRVRISSGNYGREARYERIVPTPEPPAPEYRFIEATFAPPSISSIGVSYKLRISEEPEALLTYNDSVYSSNLVKRIDSKNKIIPFQRTELDEKAFYLGFSLPLARTEFTNRKISLFPCVTEVKYGDDNVPLLPNSTDVLQLDQTEQVQLLWEYWDGQAWQQLTIRDETENFTRSGLIEFLPPGDFSPKEDFNLPPRYWLRVKWLKGDYEVEPRLKQVLLNTTMAAQTATIQKEIVGSSDGTENQTFQTTSQPILAGQELEVREPEIPSALEKDKILLEEGEKAITVTTNDTGRPQEIWVRWHQVPDFYQSEPRDRHYVFDNLTGKITFGDGRNGLIPPPGQGNIRMSRYQTGGGTAGNKPAGAIVQLKTTVPYVDKVINHQAAAGGAQAESLDSLIERAPKEIRHRQRAVTREDYEDLAKLASPEVSRAKCVPLANLKTNPLAGLETKPDSSGTVSIIIVPRSTEAKPLPSLELIKRVQNYLQAYTEPTVAISVVGALYVRVNITTEIAVTSLEGSREVAQTVEQTLASFLHPLTGGFDGMGWNFGRQPYKSDLYRLLERVPGVDHVSSLEVGEEVDDPEKLVLEDVKQTNRFLVYSGNHTINLTFVES
ncbi:MULTISPECIES: putative baseplate assembly protein [unclassified Moorena]|uniref:putative baseplate assembly protein n=1 Tax=unclassified Moorena TaxID=2683338 RepID=UPI00140064B2|nr:MULTISPECIES: putative baseplate assembly protein [unclassified Moorena]NEO15015.1 putative baseplate assembly protein [Moorena sp. SIO3E8]NEQ01419.1 putative baseplate assembly protein [Moorena sp. SIO3F7]